MINLESLDLCKQQEIWRDGDTIIYWISPSGRPTDTAMYRISKPGSSTEISCPRFPDGLLFLRVDKPDYCIYLSIDMNTQEVMSVKNQESA